ncbi:hypothetical protein [Glutamicibacter arilaitensis]|uniref:hypothetical protein n=1 Tax=Glutamicibacter arilaitensis TaxID=256701 RepID=UPI0011AED737|nr:hypothetical protein [Glutamicibacter arilaitensis]
MRKVISVIAMLLGAAALVVGIGQKTFWAPPETVTANMPQLTDEAPLTLIESSVNSPNLDPVELVITAKGEFTASLGREYDVAAWIGDAAHVSVTGIDTENHKMIAEYTKGKGEVPNPAGADIFFDSQTADKTMTYRWTAPDTGDWSLLLAAGGKDAAPVDISVTYANDDAMPFAVPLIIAGSVLLVFGLALLIMRPAKPKTGTNTQHSVAVAAVLALAISGVSLPMAPSDDSSASPSESAQKSDEAKKSDDSKKPEDEKKSEEASSSASASSSVEETASFPVITEEQLKRVLADAQEQISKADDKTSSKALDSRSAGAFKYLRNKRYEMLKEKFKVDKPLALTTQVIRSAAVPNASEAKFPRVISVVTAKNNDADTLPQALTLVQENARDNFKVVFVGQMLPNSTFPGIAVGDPSTTQLKADSKGLQMTPEKALEALAKVLSDDGAKEKSKFAKSDFIAAVHSAQKDEAKAANEAKVTYKRSVTEGDTKVVSTPDGGAIVTGKLNNKARFIRTEDADPLESKDKLTEQLLGSSSSNGDVESTYAEPVMFYLPADGSKDKIQLISASQVLLDVKEVD